jgi:hypothetical protein
MTDFARGSGPFLSASASSSLGNVNPNKPSPPTFSRWRREKLAAWKPAQAKECFGESIKEQFTGRR